MTFEFRKITNNNNKQFRRESNAAIYRVTFKIKIANKYKITILLYYHPIVDGIRDSLPIFFSGTEENMEYLSHKSIEYARLLKVYTRMTFKI